MFSSQKLLNQLYNFLLHSAEYCIKLPAPPCRWNLCDAAACSLSIVNIMCSKSITDVPLHARWSPATNLLHNFDVYNLQLCSVYDWQKADDTRQ